MTAQPLRVVDATGKRRPLRKKLTEAYCRTVKPPTAGRLVVYDTLTPGLAVSVTSKGTRTYYVVRKVDGRARRVSLKSTTLDAARKEAVKVRAEQDAGVDAVQVRRERRAKVETLAEVYAVYDRERERSPRTIVNDDSLWSLVPSWHKMRLDSITPEMVSALHSRIGNDPKRGRISANRTIQLVRRLYRFAKKRRLYRGENPAEGIDFYPEQSRERYVKPAELPALLEAIDAAGDPWADYFRLLLLTGSRRSALAAMKWADVDLDAGTWAIPATDSKNKRSVTVPLVDEAVTRLKRRRKDADAAAAFVFPARVGAGPMVNPYEAWKLVRTAAGLPDLTMHDIRRTCGSYLAAAGVSLPVIGRALGHRSQTSTMVYARLDVDDVRRELQHVGDAVTAAGKVKSKTA